MQCPRCLLRQELCLCAEIPRLETRTEVVIVRHVAERWRSSNTGRLAAFAIAGASLIDHGERGVEAVLAPAPNTWLVYPEGPPAPAPAGVARLVFLDATWHQARRMRQRLPWIRGMPIWSLPIASVPAARLRESPGAGHVSTIEAIAHALRLVEDPAAADALERLFAVHVARARASGRR